MLARQLQQPVREIVYRTRGLTHGPISRLMSPGDLGELLKPFVFLDLFVIDGNSALPPIDMGWHPHSGIATVSVILGPLRRREELDRLASDDLPLGEPQRRRGVDLSSARRTHGGVRGRARGSASDAYAGFARRDRRL